MNKHLKRLAGQQRTRKQDDFSDIIVMSKYNIDVQMKNKRAVQAQRQKM
jgi:hypothetical protein